MNNEKLINKYEKMKANKKRLTSVDLVLKDLRSLDEPEPLPFKLKDVVGRIRGFDPTTQTIWLNAILKELDGDYGLMKYRSGYEQGKFEGALVGNQLKDADKIRQKLNKVLLPSFIDDWIFKCQLLNDFSLRSALDSTTIHLYAKNSEVVKKWLNDRKNQELFAKAWLTDYDAEKEPKYKVKVKNTDDYLNETEVGFHFFNNSKKNKTFTRKELEYSDFAWVLDCPGIELEEVTE
ncbi:DUF1642 domain-containing protein [Streptococcus sp. V728]|uniref:DUF1642 domain-containing protein n=1 Tax=Streptococcus sp. V728 TaxID=3455700 RepID=UPI003F936CDA